MADVIAAAAPSAKTRSSLLSLDEVPHKRHVPPPVLSTYNPLVPEPGTPAFATRNEQFAVDTAAEIKRADEARRQQKKVDCAPTCGYASGLERCRHPVKNCRHTSMIAGSIIVRLSIRVSVRKTASSSVKGKGY